MAYVVLDSRKLIHEDDDLIEALQKANEHSSNLIELINPIRVKTVSALEELKIYRSCFEWLLEQDVDRDFEEKVFNEMKYNETIAFEIERKFVGLPVLEAVREDPLDLAKYILMLRVKLSAQEKLLKHKYFIVADSESSVRHKCKDRDNFEALIRTLSEDSVSAKCCDPSMCSANGITGTTLKQTESMTNYFSSVNDTLGTDNTDGETINGVPNTVQNDPEDSVTVQSAPEDLETVLNVTEDLETVLNVPEDLETVLNVPEDSEIEQNIPEDQEPVLGPPEDMEFVPESVESVRKKSYFEKVKPINIKFEDCPACIQYRFMIMNLKDEKSWSTINLERAVTVQRTQMATVTENTNNIYKIVKETAAKLESQRRMLKEEFRRQRTKLTFAQTQTSSNFRESASDASQEEGSLDNEQLLKDLELLKTENIHKSEQVKRLEEELHQAKLKCQSMKHNLQYTWQSLEKIRNNMKIETETDEEKNLKFLLEVPLYCSKCRSTIDDEFDVRTCESCFLIFCSLCVYKSDFSSSSKDSQKIGLCRDCKSMYPYPKSWMLMDE